MKLYFARHGESEANLLADYAVAKTRREGLVCVEWCGTRFDL